MPGPKGPIDLIDVDIIGGICLRIDHKNEAAIVTGYDLKTLTLPCETKLRVEL